MRVSLRRAAAVVALLCAFGLAGPALAVAVENSSQRFYSAEDTSDEYGGPGVTWTGPAAYGPGRSGDPDNEAFALGGDGYLTADDSTEGNFGSLPFTLRFWARFAGTGGPQAQVLSKREVCSQGTFLDVRTRNGLIYAELQDPANFQFGVLHPADVYDGAWHVITVTRNGTTLSVTVDGDTVSGQTVGVVDLDSPTPVRFGEGPCVGPLAEGGDGTTRANVLLDDISYGPGTTPTERPLVPGLPVGTPPGLSPITDLGTDPDPAPFDPPAADAPVAEPGADPAAEGAADPAAGAPGPVGSGPAGVPAGSGATSPIGTAGIPDAGVPAPPADQPGVLAPGSTAPGGPAAVPASPRPSDDGRPDRGVAAVAFADALPSPGEVGWDLGSIVQSLLFAILLLALLALPVSIVNKTAKENADRIEAAMARLRIAVVAAWSERLPFGVAMAVATAAAAVVYAFLEPTLRFDESSLALVVGLALAFLVVTAAADVSQLLYVRGLWDIRGHLQLFPGFLLLGLLCVGISRLFGLEPGLILGTLVAFATARALRTDVKGPAIAVSAISLTTVGLLAWFLRDPVVAAAGSSGSFVPEALGAMFTAIFVAAAENLAFALIPLAFLDGAVLLRWSKPVWAVFAGLGAFAFVHVLLRPTAAAGEFVGRWQFLAVLLGAYLVGAAAFWAWFRFRPSPVRSSAPS